MFGSDRFTASGDDVHLKPQQGLSIAMVVHELATNAAKYGALSQPRGKVNVRWEVRGNMFNLTWEEKGGPSVKEPAHESFGLSLVKGEIGYRLRGNVETIFDPKGLRVEMSFALES